MRYLWREKIQLDDRRLVALLGAEPHTPLNAAMAASLRAVRAGKRVTSGAERASCGSNNTPSEAIGASHDGRSRPLRTGL
jgi:hypothetical protein